MGFDNVNVNVSGPKQPTSTYKTKILKGNHSFASQVTEPNMKYVIKYDFDLGGEEVTIPENCVLEFDGGCLSNGTLVGDNTNIVASLVKIFSIEVYIDGSWKVSEAYPEWFGAVGDGVTDDYNAIQKALDFFNKCTISSIYLVRSSIEMPNYSVIDGTGTLTSDMDIYIVKVYQESRISNIIINGNTIASGIQTIKDSSKALPSRNMIYNVRVSYCIIGIDLHGIGDIIDSCVINGYNKGITCGILVRTTDHFVNNCVILQCTVGTYITTTCTFNGGKILVNTYGVIIGATTHDTLPDWDFKVTEQKTAYDVNFYDVIIQEQKYNNILVLRAMSPKLNIKSESSGNSIQQQTYDPNGYPITNFYCEYAGVLTLNMSSTVGAGGGGEKWVAFFNENYTHVGSTINISVYQRDKGYKISLINSTLPLCGCIGNINGSSLASFSNNYIDINSGIINASQKFSVLKKDGYWIWDAVLDGSSTAGARPTVRFALDKPLEDERIAIAITFKNIDVPEGQDVMRVQLSYSQDGENYTAIGIDSYDITNYNTAAVLKVATLTCTHLQFAVMTPSEAPGHYHYTTQVSIVQ